MSESNDFAVIGAGLAGLTAAYRLALAGKRPVVFERWPMPGGLARVTNINGENLELFYHHLFTTDTNYVQLAAELGLEGSIEWRPSKMGIWSNGRLWNFGTPASLLGFGPLGFSDKLRFALSTLRLQRAADPREFEDVTASDWIRQHSGEAVWKTIWSPLLRQKFAQMADEVSMVWLWRKISLRGRSRSKTGAGERLGYMTGSFSVMIDELVRRIEQNGGKIHCRDHVRRIEKDPEGGFLIVTKGGRVRANRVLAAVSVPDYLELVGHLLPAATRRDLTRLRATAALCTLLDMGRSLTPYYWLNIADATMPFGGLIEHTNYIPRARYGGSHLLYVSNYLFPDDPLYSASKEEILRTYMPALRRINPQFDSSWVNETHHYRARYAQPVVTPGYRHQIPPMKTEIEGLFLCCMAQIYPEDRGQNYAIQYGDRAARLMIEGEES